MKVSDAGVNLIAQFEGFRSKRYADVVGVLTIGYGETRSDIVAKGTITEHDARNLLRQRVDKDFGPSVDRALTRDPTQNQFDAMVSLAYNIGQGGFAGSTVVREFNRGNVRKAGQAFMMWVKAGGSTIEGLVRRRRAEVDVFFTASVKPVQYSDKERYLMRVAKEKGVSERRRVRARDWLLAQQRNIARIARRKGEGGWDRYDRSRRFQGIRKRLGIEGK